MQRVLAAGASPHQFWQMSFEETLLMIRGMEDRINVQWQQTRLITYTIACTVTPEDKRVEIYDMFYIPGDPTPEQRAEALKNEHERLTSELRDFNEELRREMAGKK